MESQFSFARRWVIKNMEYLQKDYITGHPYMLTTIKKKLQLCLFVKGIDRDSQHWLSIKMHSRDHAFECTVWIEKAGIRR